MLLFTYIMLALSTGLAVSTIYFLAENRKLHKELMILNNERKDQSQGRWQEVEHFQRENGAKFEEGYQKGLEDAKRINAAEAKVSETNSYYKGREDGKREAENEMAIEVTPFYRSSKTGYPGFKKTVYEFGYEYQLTVKGLPCLDASEKIVGSEKEAEVNREEILSLTQDIISSALSAKTGLPFNLLSFKKAVHKPVVPSA